MEWIPHDKGSLVNKTDEEMIRMAVQRDFPYNNAHFRVEFPAFPENIFFDEVLLPELLVEAVEVREGNDPDRASRKYPGATRFTNLVLRRGFNGSLALYQWWKATSDGDPGARQDGTIYLLDEEGNAVSSWRINQSFPVRYSVAPLIGLDGSILFETLEVCCATVKME